MFQKNAAEYIKDHRIQELFEQLTTALVYNRPDDPRSFIKEHLEQLKKNKDDPEKNTAPSLFDETNLGSVFWYARYSRKGPHHTCTVHRGNEMYWHHSI